MQRWADGTFTHALTNELGTYQVSTMRHFSSLCSGFESWMAATKPLFEDEKNADISKNIEQIRSMVFERILPNVGKCLMAEFDKPVGILKDKLDLCHAIFDSIAPCMRDGSKELFQKLVPYRALAADIAGAVASIVELQVGEVETLRVQFLSHQHRVTLTLLDIFDPEFDGPFSALRLSGSSVAAMVNMKIKHENYSSWYSVAAPKLGPVAANWIDVSGLASTAIAVSSELMTATLNAFSQQMQHTADAIVKTTPPTALVTNLKLVVDATLQKTLDHH